LTSHSRIGIDYGVKGGSIPLFSAIIVVQGSGGRWQRSTSRPVESGDSGMQLSIEDVDHFFRLHKPLMFYVSQKARSLTKRPVSIGAYAGWAPNDRIEVHKALLGQMSLIDEFIAENPFQFEPSDLEIVRSWHQMVSGKFIAYRPLKDHMIFLNTEAPPMAYGVVALYSPFEDVIGPYLPRMIQTTLLPFKGRIVYDGLMSGYNITFGSGIKRRFREEYEEAKARLGIITSLPMGDPGPRAVPKKSAPSKAPKKAKAVNALPLERIVALTDGFCRDHLDEEYATLCRKLAGVLARKRPSPLTSGKPEGWAAGIVRVIGWMNFLGDPSQPHHMKMSDIDKKMGVSEATGSAKATAIRKLLKLHGFDVEWTLPSFMEQNPMVWMLKVNGLMMDIRDCPREAQEAAFQQGLIPFIPADRKK
jgi:hypothetical protein